VNELLFIIEVYNY